MNRVLSTDKSFQVKESRIAVFLYAIYIFKLKLTFPTNL